MLGEKKSTRFNLVLRENTGGAILLIFVDTKTGVQYLDVNAGTGSGVTLIADAEGRPLINEEWKQEQEQ